MWEITIGLLILLFGCALIVWIFQRAQASDLTRQRLRLPTSYEVDDNELTPFDLHSPIMRRWRWLVIVIGCSLACLLWLLVPWPWPYILAFGVMSTMMLWQFEQWWLQRRLNRAEQQLADSIDMMVAAVKSGASLQGALESAMENTPKPWNGELNHLIAKIRYGDDPVEVLSELSQRVPLETIQLFSQTLAVNWSVGGKLSLALANVAKTIRDRLELSRRMHAMTTQARLSVISVIFVTYFIMALMWRNDPERMVDYLTSMVGQAMVSIAILLQAIGIVWISRLSTPRF